MFSGIVSVTRSTSWCVPSPTMARTCLNQSSPREWARIRASSTTSNGMNCKSFLFSVLNSLSFSVFSNNNVIFVLSVHAADTAFVCPRINFPIAVAVLPLESILSLALFGVLNQNASGSPDSNKQRKAPELLGKVSMPLFDFRRWGKKSSR